MFAIVDNIDLPSTVVGQPTIRRSFTSVFTFFPICNFFFIKHDFFNCYSRTNRYRRVILLGSRVQWTITLDMMKRYRALLLSLATSTSIFGFFPICKIRGAARSLQLTGDSPHSDNPHSRKHVFARSYQDFQTKTFFDLRNFFLYPVTTIGLGLTLRERNFS